MKIDIDSLDLVVIEINISKFWILMEKSSRNCLDIISTGSKHFKYFVSDEKSRRKFFDLVLVKIHIEKSSQIVENVLIDFSNIAFINSKSSDLSQSRKVLTLKIIF